ncbi:MAG: two-component system regulatory protein YycI [Clostridiaceae bacterium]|nr:two-component system regulatory protein YycI [Clostridiaceae bacterium]
MDWAKAKTILIAVFLVVNIFLVSIIFGASTSSIGYVDSEKIGLITEYLAEKNITVTGKVPTKKNDMSSITVKYKLFKKEDIAGSFFSQEEKAAESISGSTVKLKGKDIEISIKDSRELNYTDSSISPAEAIDEKICRKNIEEFLNRLGMKDHVYIRTSEDLEGYKRFVYVQSFKGAAIYNSIMEFYVNDSGIRGARVVWFETVRQAGKKTEVISPVIALLYLPKHSKNSAIPSMEVLEIQQGYYFGTGESDQVDVSKVEEGTAFPVWRIITNTDIIYINAYNEKVEGIEKRQ